MVNYLFAASRERSFSAAAWMCWSWVLDAVLESTDRGRWSCSGVTRSQCLLSWFINIKKGWKLPLHWCTWHRGESDGWQPPTLWLNHVICIRIQIKLNPSGGRCRALLLADSGGLLVTLQAIRKCGSDHTRARTCGLAQLERGCPSHRVYWWMEGKSGEGSSNVAPRAQVILCTQEAVITYFRPSQSLTCEVTDDAAEQTSLFSLYRCRLLSDKRTKSVIWLQLGSQRSRPLSESLHWCLFLLCCHGATAPHIQPICSCFLFQGSFTSDKGAADDSSRAGIARRSLW